MAHLPIVVLICLDDEHDSHLDVVLNPGREKGVNGDFWLHFELFDQCLQQVLLTGVFLTENLDRIVVVIILY